jgi:general secretion pathway protein K
VTRTRPHLHRSAAGRTRQRGLALIIAMLVAALAAAVAISLASAQSQWAAQVMQRRDQVQAQSIALAGIQWTRQILDAAHAAPFNHLGEPWAMPLPATPVENGSVEGRIVDAQGMLNVNNLASGGQSAPERHRFTRLFEALRVAPSTLAAMIDWVDSDSVEEPGGAENAWYQRMAQPGLAPDMPATRIEELGDVRGMTATVLGGLIRYVTALPGDTPLNVNTAAAELLAASVDGVDAAALAGFVASRAQRPFTSVAEFRQRLPAGATLVGTDSMYTTKSRYFLVSVTARQGDTIARARALVDREGTATPRIVWQTIE